MQPLVSRRPSAAQIMGDKDCDRGRRPPPPLERRAERVDRLRRVVAACEWEHLERHEEELAETLASDQEWWPLF